MELFVFGSVVIAGVALMIARSTRQALADQRAMFERRFELVGAQLAQLRRALPAGAIAAAPGASESAPLVSAAAQEPAAAPLASAGIPVAERLDAKAALAPATSSSGEAAALLHAAAAEPIAAAAPATAPAAGPAPAAAARASEGQPEPSFEEKIALVWFTRIGAMALLIGVAFFFKYAVDNDWIGPTGRIALGALIGAALLGAAELTRARTKATYIQVLLGVGLSFLFLTAYASHAFYNLVPMPAAFAALMVVSLLGGALSVRHRGEPILVLSLLAACAAPVLLSTGEDRPAALFGYLLVVTALAFATSVRMGFRYATWLGIAGPTILFAGWHAKFFDVHAPHSAPLLEPMTEDAAEPLAAGAYFPLSARAVPLGAAALFLAEWLFVYAGARRRDRALQAAQQAVPRQPLLQPLALLVGALLLAHAAFASLLFDRPALLGGVLAGLGLLAAYLLGKEDRRELLGAPLLAAFLVLLCTVYGARSEPTGMLAVLGLVGVVYAGGFLRGQLGSGQPPSDRTVQLLGGTGVLIAIASGLLLFELHPTAFAFVLAALSLAYAGLALLLSRPAMAAGAVLFSLGGLLAIHAEHPSPPSTAFLLAAAAWSSVYFGAGAYDLLARKAAPGAARLFSVSAAGLGLALLVEWSAPGEQWLLRTGVLALVGLADFVLGAALLRQGSRKPATVLLGQALGLFAGAAAVLFSGATVTVIWAALAAVVAVLAAVEDDPLWLAGAAALFVVTLVRALAIDFPLPEQLREQFLGSFGKVGQLRQTFLLNPRAAAFVGSAAALLVAARSAARSAARGARAEFRQCAVAFAVAGHALLAALAVLESQSLYLSTRLPVPEQIPFAFDGSFVAHFSSALIAQQHALSVLTTVVMALYAAMLISIGFGARSPVHRLLGLGLFSLALAKLVAWDVWRLPRIYQMVVLVSMGALLLASSYLYARFGKRLVKLLRDGELPVPRAGTTALLVLLAGSLAAAPARAVEVEKFAQARSIEGPGEGIGEGASGVAFYRAEIDPALYAASREQLADVRIVGAHGEELPFLVRDIPAAAESVQHAATLVDPVALPDGSARAVLDLGRSGLKHSEVALDIDGSDFLRRTRVEISSDEVHFDPLAEGALVYRVQSGEASGQGTSIAYPVSDARYLRVTLLPGAGQPPLRIVGARVAYVSEAARPPLRTLPASVAVVPRSAEEKARAAASSLLEIDLDAGAAGRQPGAGAPIESLQLDIADPIFERRAALRASDDGHHWSSLGGGLLYRAAGAEGTLLRFSPTRARFLRLEIFDGNDPSLTVRGALAGYRPQEILFRSAAQGAGPLTLLVGDAEAAPPVYDLPAVVARYGSALEPSTVQLGPLHGNPAWRAPAMQVPPPPPASERHKAAIVALLGLLLLGLSLWTVRLLKSSSDAPPPDEAA